MQHAADELRHADMVSNRIIQLGGTPITTPKKWFDLANCAYDEPSTQIPQDEVMHEEDLQALQEDLKSMLRDRA